MQEADLIGLGAGEGLSILHALLGFKLSFPVDSQGGVADVYVDGVKRGTVSFYGATAGRAHAPFVGLDAGKGRLAWTGLLDLDLYLVDPTGQRVASGATTANPENLEFTVKQPGTYTFEVTGFATAAATCSLISTVTRAVSPP